MALYNHVAIWNKKPEYWPRSYFTNGYIKVDDEKMSKSKGNFLTLRETCDKYSSDACRFALADSGDSMDDANFVPKIADEGILKMTTMDMYFERMIKDFAKYRDSDNNNPNLKFYDIVFEN